jgi:hypothetical protein
LTVASLGVGSAADAQAGEEDSVIGSGVFDFHGEFTIDARSGPSGESPTGSVSSDGDVQFSGPITCLRVHGNVAVVNARTERYGIMTLSITDEPTRDAIESFPAGRSPTDCSPFSSDFGGERRSGDLVVVDAPGPVTRLGCVDQGGQVELRGSGSGYPAGETLNFFIFVTYQDRRRATELIRTTNATGSVDLGALAAGDLPIGVGVVAYRDADGDGAWGPDIDDTVYRGDGTVRECATLTLTSK